MIEQEKLKAILIRDLGISNLPLADQEKIVADLGESVMKKIILAIFDHLPETAQGEFSALVQSGDPAKLQTFLKDQIVDLDTLMQKTIQETIGRYKELIGVK